MILTGSPITQNPLDLFSQYKMLDESILEIHSMYLKTSMLYWGFSTNQ